MSEEKHLSRFCARTSFSPGSSPDARCISAERVTVGMYLSTAAVAASAPTSAASDRDRTAVATPDVMSAAAAGSTPAAASPTAAATTAPTPVTARIASTISWGATVRTGLVRASRTPRRATSAPLYLHRKESEPTPAVLGTVSVTTAESGLRSTGPAGAAIPRFTATSDSAGETTLLAGNKVDEAASGTRTAAAHEVDKHLTAARPARLVAQTSCSPWSLDGVQIPELYSETPNVESPRLSFLRVSDRVPVSKFPAYSVAGNGAPGVLSVKRALSATPDRPPVPSACPAGTRQSRASWEAMVRDSTRRWAPGVDTPVVVGPSLPCTFACPPASCGVTIASPRSSASRPAAPALASRAANSAGPAVAAGFCDSVRSVGAQVLAAGPTSAVSASAVPASAGPASAATGSAGPVQSARACTASARADAACAAAPRCAPQSAPAIARQVVCQSGGAVGDARSPRQLGRGATARPPAPALRRTVVSLSITVISHSLEAPVPGLDPVVAPFSSKRIVRVPVIRIYGVINEAFSQRTPATGRCSCRQPHGSRRSACSDSSNAVSPYQNGNSNSSSSLVCPDQCRGITGPPSVRSTSSSTDRNNSDSIGMFPDDCNNISTSDAGGHGNGRNKHYGAKACTASRSPVLPVHKIPGAAHPGHTGTASRQSSPHECFFRSLLGPPVAYSAVVRKLTSPGGLVQPLNSLKGRSCCAVVHGVLPYFFVPLPLEAHAHPRRWLRWFCCRLREAEQQLQQQPCSAGSSDRHVSSAVQQGVVSDGARQAADSSCGEVDSFRRPEQQQQRTYSDHGHRFHRWSCLSAHHGERHMLIYDVRLVWRRSIYGYDHVPRLFAQIFTLLPGFQTRRLAGMLLQGSVTGQLLQPFEVHIPFTVHFLADFRLRGMDMLIVCNPLFVAPVVLSPEQVCTEDGLLRPLAGQLSTHENPAVAAASFQRHTSPGAFCSEDRDASETKDVNGTFLGEGRAWVATGSAPALLTQPPAGVLLFASWRELWHRLSRAAAEITAAHSTTHCTHRRTESDAAACAVAARHVIPALRATSSEISSRGSLLDAAAELRTSLRGSDASSDGPVAFSCSVSSPLLRPPRVCHSHVWLFSECFSRIHSGNEEKRKLCVSPSRSSVHKEGAAALTNEIRTPLRGDNNDACFFCSGRTHSERSTSRQRAGVGTYRNGASSSSNRSSSAPTASTSNEAALVTSSSQCRNNTSDKQENTAGMTNRKAPCSTSSCTCAHWCRSGNSWRADDNWLKEEGERIHPYFPVSKRVTSCETEFHVLASQILNPSFEEAKGSSDSQCHSVCQAPSDETGAPVPQQPLLAAVRDYWQEEAVRAAAFGLQFPSQVYPVKLTPPPTLPPAAVAALQERQRCLANEAVPQAYKDMLRRLLTRVGVLPSKAQRQHHPQESQSNKDRQLRQQHQRQCHLQLCPLQHPQLQREQLRSEDQDNAPFGTAKHLRCGPLEEDRLPLEKQNKLSVASARGMLPHQPAQPGPALAPCRAKTSGAPAGTNTAATSVAQDVEGGLRGSSAWSETESRAPACSCSAPLPCTQETDPSSAEYREGRRRVGAASCSRSTSAIGEGNDREKRFLLNLSQEAPSPSGMRAPRRQQRQQSGPQWRNSLPSHSCNHLPSSPYASPAAARNSNVRLSPATGWRPHDLHGRGAAMACGTFHSVGERSPTMPFSDGYTAFAADAHAADALAATSASATVHDFADCSSSASGVNSARHQEKRAIASASRADLTVRSRDDPTPVNIQRAPAATDTSTDRQHGQLVYNKEVSIFVKSTDCSLVVAQPKHSSTGLSEAVTGADADAEARSFCPQDSLRDVDTSVVGRAASVTAAAEEREEAGLWRTCGVAEEFELQQQTFGGSVGAMQGASGPKSPGADSCDHRKRTSSEQLESSEAPSAVEWLQLPSASSPSRESSDEEENQNIEEKSALKLRKLPKRTRKCCRVTSMQGISAKYATTGASVWCSTDSGYGASDDSDSGGASPEHITSSETDHNKMQLLQQTDGWSNCRILRRRTDRRRAAFVVPHGKTQAQEQGVQQVHWEPHAPRQRARESQPAPRQVVRRGNRQRQFQVRTQSGVQEGSPVGVGGHQQPEALVVGEYDDAELQKSQAGEQDTAGEHRRRGENDAATVKAAATGQSGATATAVGGAAGLFIETSIAAKTRAMTVAEEIGAGTQAKVPTDRNEVTPEAKADSSVLCRRFSCTASEEHVAEQGGGENVESCYESESRSLSHGSTIVLSNENHGHNARLPLSAEEETVVIDQSEDISNKSSLSSSPQRKQQTQLQIVERNVILTASGGVADDVPAISIQNQSEKFRLPLHSRPPLAGGVPAFCVLCGQGSRSTLEPGQPVSSTEPRFLEGQHAADSSGLAHQRRQTGQQQENTQQEQRQERVVLHQGSDAEVVVDGWPDVPVQLPFYGDPRDSPLHSLRSAALAANVCSSTTHEPEQEQTHRRLGCEEDAPWEQQARNPAAATFEQHVLKERTRVASQWKVYKSRKTRHRQHFSQATSPVTLECHRVSPAVDVAQASPLDESSREAGKHAQQHGQLQQWQPRPRVGVALGSSEGTHLERRRYEAGSNVASAYLNHESVLQACDSSDAPTREEMQHTISSGDETTANVVVTRSSACENSARVYSSHSNREEWPPTRLLTWRFCRSPPARHIIFGTCPAGINRSLERQTRLAQRRQQRSTNKLRRVMAHEIHRKSRQRSLAVRTPLYSAKRDVDCGTLYAGDKRGGRAKQTVMCALPRSQGVKLLVRPSHPVRRYSQSFSHNMQFCRSKALQNASVETGLSTAKSTDQLATSVTLEQCDTTITAELRRTPTANLTLQDIRERTVTSLTKEEMPYVGTGFMRAAELQSAPGDAEGGGGTTENSLLFVDGGGFRLKRPLSCERSATPFQEESSASTRGHPPCLETTQLCQEHCTLAKPAETSGSQGHPRARIRPQTTLARGIFRQVCDKVPADAAERETVAEQAASDNRLDIHVVCPKQDRRFPVESCRLHCTSPAEIGTSVTGTSGRARASSCVTNTTVDESQDDAAGGGRCSQVSVDVDTSAISMAIQKMKTVTEATKTDTDPAGAAAAAAAALSDYHGRRLLYGSLVAVEVLSERQGCSEAVPEGVGASTPWKDAVLAVAFAVRDERLRTACEEIRRRIVWRQEKRLQRQQPVQDTPDTVQHQSTSRPGMSTRHSTQELHDIHLPAGRAAFAELTTVRQVCRSEEKAVCDRKGMSRSASKGVSEKNNEDRIPTSEEFQCDRAARTEKSDLAVWYAGERRDGYSDITTACRVEHFADNRCCQMKGGDSEVSAGTGEAPDLSHVERGTGGTLRSLKVKKSLSEKGCCSVGTKAEQAVRRGTPGARGRKALSEPWAAEERKLGGERTTPEEQFTEGSIRDLPTYSDALAVIFVDQPYVTRKVVRTAATSMTAEVGESISPENSHSRKEEGVVLPAEDGVQPAWAAGIAKEDWSEAPFPGSFADFVVSWYKTHPPADAHAQLKNYVPRNTQVFPVKNEHELLRKTAVLLTLLDPSFVLQWDGNNAGLGYLLRRAAVLGCHREFCRALYRRVSTGLRSWLSSRSAFLQGSVGGRLSKNRDEGRNSIHGGDDSSAEQCHHTRRVYQEGCCHLAQEGSKMSARVLLNCWHVLQQEVKLQLSTLEGVVQEVLGVTFPTIPVAVLLNLWKQGQLAQRHVERRDERMMLAAWKVWERRRIRSRWPVSWQPHAGVESCQQSAQEQQKIRRRRERSYQEWKQGQQTHARHTEPHRRKHSRNKSAYHGRSVTVDSCSQRNLDDLTARHPRDVGSGDPNWGVATMGAVLKYLLGRLQAMLALIDRVDVIPRTAELARLYGCDFQSALLRGSQFKVESVMLRATKRLGYVFASPSQKQVTEQMAPLCIPLVLEPHSGFYWSPVLVLDFQSLYPSIMIANNICFSTSLGSVDVDPTVRPVKAFGVLNLHMPPRVFQQISLLHRRFSGQQMSGQHTLHDVDVPVVRAQISAGRYSHVLRACHPSTDTRASREQAPPDGDCETQQLDDPLDCGVNVLPNGSMFVSSKVRQGVFPRVLWDLLRTRVMIKQLMNLYRECGNQKLVQLLNHRQHGLKMITNVTYGYTAASFTGHMPCAEVADAIVQTARTTLLRAIQLVENTPRWGGRVLYGDTDSLFVLVEKKSLKAAFEIGREIAYAVTQQNPSPVELQLEKVFLPCCLVSKKRYVGYAYTSPCAKPSFDAKGVESVRRDQCGCTSTVLESTLRTFFTTRDLSCVKRHLRRQWTKILRRDISLKQFIFFRKCRLGSYKAETGAAASGSLPPQAKVAYERMCAVADICNPGNVHPSPAVASTAQVLSRVDLQHGAPTRGERVPFVYAETKAGNLERFRARQTGCVRLLDFAVSPDKVKGGGRSGLWMHLFCHGTPQLTLRNSFPRTAADRLRNDVLGSHGYWCCSDPESDKLPNRLSDVEETFFPRGYLEGHPSQTALHEYAVFTGVWRDPKVISERRALGDAPNARAVYNKGVFRSEKKYEQTLLPLHSRYYIVKQIIPALDRLFSLLPPPNTVDLSHWYMSIPKARRNSPFPHRRLRGCDGTRGLQRPPPTLAARVSDRHQGRRDDWRRSQLQWISSCRLPHSAQVMTHIQNGAGDQLGLPTVLRRCCLFCGKRHAQPELLHVLIVRTAFGDNTLHLLTEEGFTYSCSEDHSSVLTSPACPGADVSLISSESHGNGMQRHLHRRRGNLEMRCREEDETLKDHRGVCRGALRTCDGRSFSPTPQQIALRSVCEDCKIKTCVAVGLTNELKKAEKQYLEMEALCEACAGSKMCGAACSHAWHCDVYFSKLRNENKISGLLSRMHLMWTG